MNITSSSALCGDAYQCHSRTCNVDDCDNDQYKQAVVDEEKVNREADPLIPTLTLQNQQRARQQSEPRVAVKWNRPWTAVVGAFSRLPNPLITVTPVAGIVLMWRTHDGGETWKRVASPPFASQVSQVFHFAIAYGPAPDKKHQKQHGTCKDECNTAARLYWVGSVFDALATDPVVTTLPAGFNRVAFSFSDNDGDSWSPLQYIDPVGLGLPQAQLLTGTVPEIATDINPCSPGYGNVYVTYNFQQFGAGGLRGLGARILWSSNYGCSFKTHELDVGLVCPESLRALPTGAVVNENFSQPTFTRVAVAPTGDVFVCFTQQLAYQQLAASALVTVAISLFVQRYVLQGRNCLRRRYLPVLVGTLPVGVPAPGGFGFFVGNNTTSFAFEINPVTGAIYVGAHTFLLTQTPYGQIVFWRSEDCGQTFEQLCLPTRVAGQSSIRPDLAIACDGKHMVLRFVTVEDLPTGTLLSALVGQYHIFTTNSGRTWSEPQPTTPIRVRTDTLQPNGNNGPGVHHRVEALTKRKFLAVYSDSRFGNNLATSIDFGNTDVFAAQICLPRDCAEPCDKKGGEDKKEKDKLDATPVVPNQFNLCACQCGTTSATTTTMPNSACAYSTQECCDIQHLSPCC